MKDGSNTHHTGCGAGVARSRVPSSFRWWLLDTVLSVALLVAVAATAAEPEHWLNVRDCGASGSKFETTAASTAGSKQITVANVGDFKVGQGVMVSKCNPHYTNCILKPPENPYSTTPLGDAAELRGYDGGGGSWLIFLVEVNGAEPLTFRWSDDMARTW